jgi:septal ring factor EnvC (AmiA/AmiB activator)
LQARVFPMLNQMATIKPAQAVPGQMMNSVVSAVQHAEAHLDTLLQSGAVKEKDIAPEIKALKAAQQILAQIGEQAQKEEAAQNAAAQAQAGNEMTAATQAMRSAGIDPSQVASRVMQAAGGGAMGMPPPQPGTGGPGGGPVPNPTPMSIMTGGGAPPAQPSPLTAAPQGAG